MQEAEVRELVASERRELAGLLHGLSPAQWDAPSLCAGWRVREVVAHITMPFRYSLLQVAGGVVKDRGNVHRTSDRYARRDAAALTTPELLASLADNAERVWKPPGGGIQGALSHDVIHGLDITTALGADRLFRWTGCVRCSTGSRLDASPSSASSSTASSYAPTT